MFKTLSSEASSPAPAPSGLVFLISYFLIEGGLYSETAMREAKSKNTVYSRHQGLQRASHLTKNTYAWSTHTA